MWIVVIVVVVFGGYMLMNRDAVEDTNSMQEMENEMNQAGGSEETAPDVVLYGDAGFAPKTVTIRTGETVEFMNGSKQDLHVSFGEHLDHDAYPDKKTHPNLPKNGAFTDIITFPTAGTYEYHNHHNEEHTGVVVVE